MSEPGVPPAAAQVCALASCDTPISQPPGGGRKRLYCCNAHRAEARRLRMTDTPTVGPVDVLASALDRLQRVTEDLQLHQSALRSIDPAAQSLELARVKAEATTEILAAQQIAARAAEDAARTAQRLAAERGEWDRQRSALETHLASARAGAEAANDKAATAQRALPAVEAAHRAEMHQRDEQVAAAAAAHGDQLARITDDLDQARAAAAASRARAESADQRAQAAEEAAQTAAVRTEQAQGDLNRYRVNLARAQGTVELVTARAEAAERQLEEARSELRIERERNDTRVAQLDQQLTRLASKKPTSPRKASSGAPATVRTRRSPTLQPEP